METSEMKSTGDVGTSEYLLTVKEYNENKVVSITEKDLKDILKRIINLESKVYWEDKDMIEFAEFCENDKYPQFDELLSHFKSTKRASNR
jgi:hypothetical protein